MFIPFGRQHIKNRFIGEVNTPSVGYYDRPELHADEFLSKTIIDLSLNPSNNTPVRILIIVYIVYKVYLPNTSYQINISVGQ